MEFRVELTDRAKRDLGYLFARINAAESLAAARWFNGLEKAVYSLARLPRRCLPAPESKKSKRQIRHLLYGHKPDVYRAFIKSTKPTKLFTCSVSATVRWRKRKRVS
jgi:plasmid stabilization system protein ParE